MQAFGFLEYGSFLDFLGEGLHSSLQAKELLSILGVLRSP